MEAKTVVGTTRGPGVTTIDEVEEEEEAAVVVVDTTTATTETEDMVTREVAYYCLGFSDYSVDR